MCQNSFSTFLSIFGLSKRFEGLWNNFNCSWLHYVFDIIENDIQLYPSISCHYNDISLCFIWPKEYTKVYGHVLRHGAFLMTLSIQFDKNYKVTVL